MKSLLLPLAAVAALSGCAGYYGDPYYGAYGYPGSSYGSYGYAYPSVNIGIRGGDGRAWRDRDRDGIADRYDRDRDGDGVPNRVDSRPRDPRWR